MHTDRWSALALASQDEDAPWEIFHENSKTDRHASRPSNDQVVAHMREMLDALPYEDHPAVPLPEPRGDAPMPLLEAMGSRVSARRLEPGKVALRDLATLLHVAYGITRSNEDSGFPRPFRMVPSGGAMYPLELYVLARNVEGLAPGLYHFDPARRVASFLRPEDPSGPLVEAFVQPELAQGASFVLLLTAVFGRSVYKYGDRGYRFILLEAGHAAQNVLLAATALRLGAVGVGGYHDRVLDESLGLDGVTHSTVYAVAVGHAGADAP